jgi:hypothetical protein
METPGEGTRWSWSGDENSGDEISQRFGPNKKKANLMAFFG